MERALAGTGMMDESSCRGEGLDLEFLEAFQAWLCSWTSVSFVLMLFISLGSLLCLFWGEGQHSQLMLGECSGREASLETALLSAAHGKALRLPFQWEAQEIFWTASCGFKKTHPVVI